MWAVDYESLQCVALYFGYKQRAINEAYVNCHEVVINYNLVRTFKSCTK